MVKIDKIYTGGGDSGQTSLVNGNRCSKFSHRVHAMGEIDETNSVIGLACNVSERKNKTLLGTLSQIQNDLFDLGADIATPGDKWNDGTLRIQENQVRRLEKQIDQFNSSIDPLNSFVLPGGSNEAAWLHLARAITRRAERAVVGLSEIEPVNPLAIKFLNRLSDLLFVLARLSNSKGRSDVLWVPGLTAKDHKNE